MDGKTLHETIRGDMHERRRITNNPISSPVMGRRYYERMRFKFGGTGNGAGAPAPDDNDPPPPAALAPAPDDNNPPRGDIVRTNTSTQSRSSTETIHNAFRTERRETRSERTTFNQIVVTDHQPGLTGDRDSSNAGSPCGWDDDENV